MKNKYEYRKLAQEKIDHLHKKYLRSKTIYLILNITLIVMSSFMGLLSAYAIAKNTNLDSVAIFIAIAFLTAIMSFITAIITTFNLKNRYKLLTENIEALKMKLAKLENGEITDMREFLATIAILDIVD